MADYRRADQPGGTYFFTLATYQRQPLFADAANIDRLRAAVLAVINERPFEFLAGVVLPDHAHYLWTLPEGDADFSTRIGRMKALFTKSLQGNGGRCPPNENADDGGRCLPYGNMNVGWASPTMTPRSTSRIKHRDADVWDGMKGT